MHFNPIMLEAFEDELRKIALVDLSPTILKTLRGEQAAITSPTPTIAGIPAPGAPGAVTPAGVAAQQVSAKTSSGAVAMGKPSASRTG